MGRARLQWTDFALTAGLLGLSGSLLLASPDWNATPAAWSLVVAHTTPVVSRRRSPRAAFAVSMAAGALYVALGWPMVGLGLASLVMTYALAASVPRRQSLVGLATIEAVLVMCFVAGATNVTFDTLAGNLVVLAAAWALGDGVRRRREDALADQRRSAQDAVASERLRIARELHDVVAHSMSVIAVQAGTGRMVIDDDIEHARRALVTIEEASKQALDEMRRLLRVLRSEDADPAARAPAPTLDDLDRLVAHAVDGCTPVDVVVDGHRERVPAGVELAAFRVLQEALTNVRRHAPGAPARVHVAYEPQALVVEVANPILGGPTSGPTAGGHGLIGMRERVSVYQGTFEAGPGADGTFRVSARLPYRREVP